MAFIVSFSAIAGAVVATTVVWEIFVFNNFCMLTISYGEIFVQLHLYDNF